MIPLVERAASAPTRMAIVDANGEHSYGDVRRRAQSLARRLLNGRKDLEQERVAFLTTANADYVAAQWGIWLAGGVAVPLAPAFPLPEIRHIISDADPVAVVTNTVHSAVISAAVGDDARVIQLASDTSEVTAARLPDIDAERNAMMLYTSGTSGRPKGVVSTHNTIAAQIRSLVSAWEWQPGDRILNVLPLHHLHGAINVVSCALWSGATCVMADRFDADDTWNCMDREALSLFMGVPTIYMQLIRAWALAPPARQRLMSAAAGRLRLMVSGSAALPPDVLHRWEAITGHRLLERYGMTEIGMALSNPLHGVRRPGFVGRPLPGVSVKLASSNLDTALKPADTSGEILVRGETVFSEYWRRPGETAAAFEQGWFKTGDEAIVENGDFRIIGRQSSDIIKTGGYKVSALEIEAALRRHPAISECAVIGIADPEWGQRIAAVAVCHDGMDVAEQRLIAWSRDQMAPYKTPRLFQLVERLPRNIMGKVQKHALAELFVTAPSSQKNN